MSHLLHLRSFCPLLLKSSATMHLTDPPPTRSSVGTSAATTWSTQDSRTPRCASSRDRQAACEMARTVPREPRNCRQLQAKCSSFRGEPVSGLQKLRALPKRGRFEAFRRGK